MEELQKHNTKALGLLCVASHVEFVAFHGKRRVWRGKGGKGHLEDFAVRVMFVDELLSLLQEQKGTYFFLDGFFHAARWHRKPALTHRVGLHRVCTASVQTLRRTTVVGRYCRLM